MKQYLELLEHILTTGTKKEDRTGTGTISVFGHQTRYDLRAGFPAVTTKKLAWRAVVSELLWFLEGSSDERRLAAILYGDDYDNSQTTVWTGNANAAYWVDKAQYAGDIGRGYGAQWRSWNSGSGPVVDQIKLLIDGIKKDPNGRRHIVTAWNPSDLDYVALPPCHCLFQFNVTEGKLDCQLYQRSMDAFLGAPFNIASYALLTHMVAQVCNLKVGQFIHTVGDLHIYSNHIEQVKLQLTRTPNSLPTLWINPQIDDITKFSMADFALNDYRYADAIRATMAL